MKDNDFKGRRRLRFHYRRLGNSSAGENSPQEISFLNDLKIDDFSLIFSRFSHQSC